MDARLVYVSFSGAVLRDSYPWQRVIWGDSYPFLGLYELEMLGRELGLISGGIVGTKPAERQKLRNVNPVRLLRALPPPHNN